MSNGKTGKDKPTLGFSFPSPSFSFSKDPHHTGLASSGARSGPKETDSEKKGGFLIAFLRGEITQRWTHPPGFRLDTFARFLTPQPHLDDQLPSPYGL